MININNKRIYYYSTNRFLSDGNKINDKVCFKDAVFSGIAKDNGLYMPERIPLISKRELVSMKGMSYSKVAYTILGKYLKEEISEGLLNNLLDEIYNFDVPIELIDKSVYLMRLDRGPTGSFKDFGALFMAKVVKLLKNENKLIILVATSGDTGSAIGNAFKGMENIKVYIVYPKEEISIFQEKQLRSIGYNVSTIAIKGKFDDCQKLVKEAFVDKDLKLLNLFSANSINISRLLPQIVYYFYAYSRIANEGDKVVFSIPSGNFGNSLGCELARRMGLPVKKIIIATNENNAFSRLFKTGFYNKIEPSIKCLSNAMNVGNPSNLARFFDLYGGILDKEGIVYKYPDLEKMKRYISTYSISDEETIRMIKDIYYVKGKVLEPHGAVAVAAFYKYYYQEEKSKTIILETAHPVKFQELLWNELNIKIGIPEWIEVNDKEENANEVLENNYRLFKEYLLDKEG